MESRRAGPLCFLTLTAIVVVGTALAVDTPEQSDDHDTSTTRKDGCRVRPASHRVGVEVDCSGLRLGYIPKDLPTGVRSLVLRGNNITRLSDYALQNHTQLKYLDLSRNNLQELGAHAFSGLSGLEKLDLTYNMLCMDNDTFPVGLFSGMTSLRRLTLTSNTCKTQHSGYPADALGHLTTLEYLSLTGIPVTGLGDGFSRLANLKTLVFAGHGCEMPVVRNVTFDSLRNANVSHLCIKACHLETLEAGALKPLSRLKVLNLACNQEVDFRNVYAAITNVKNMTLNTLVVDDVTPTSLPLVKETFQHNAFTNVERLSIRANYITEVDVRVFRPLKRLTHFNLGYNVIMRMLPEVNSTEALLSTLFGLNLDVVDLSDTFTSMSVYRRRYCFREARPSEEDPPDPTDYFFRKPPKYADVDYSRPSQQQVIVPSYHGKKDPAPIPPSVQVVYADNANIKASSGATFSVAIDNDVVVLNISHNRHITRVGIVRGLRHCQVLDARNCSINTIRRGALRDMRMLKYLFLMDNNIGKNGYDLSGMFDGLSALETLDLSGNAISHIHSSAFSSLSNLRCLSLRGNHLTSISFSFSGLQYIYVINLADNNIRYIAPRTMDKTRSSHRCVFIDLCCNPVQVRNPFGCKNDVATCREATCIKDIHNDQNNATGNNRSSHIAGMNKTLMTSLVTTAVVSVAVIAIVIAVFVSNDHRRTRFIGWLRRIPRIARYRQLNTDVEM